MKQVLFATAGAILFTLGMALVTTPAHAGGSCPTLFADSDATDKKQSCLDKLDDACENNAGCAGKTTSCCWAVGVGTRCVEKTCPKDNSLKVSNEFIGIGDIDRELQKLFLGL